MKILLTGANGYIGSRLIPYLVGGGHQVVALVRNKRALSEVENVSVLEGDLLKKDTLDFPRDIEAAFYLVHSMGEQASGFSKMEAECAKNFTEAVEKTDAKQVVYLSGLSRGADVSEHMKSRHTVEEILKGGEVPVTILRAGIILGSGSASFEIISDLVKKLPIMVAPKWVKSKCQPIAIQDVLYYLANVLGRNDCYDQTFEIGGPDILNYKEMLYRLAEIRRYKRVIITVPVLTPYLSSLWLFFVTSVNFSIARALVDSLKTDAVCREHRIDDILPHRCLSFDEAIKAKY